VTKPTDERYTPGHVLRIVREFSPSIGLDPCSTVDNPTSALRYFTVDDGDLSLSCEWRTNEGVCFVNPPYSRGQLAKWASKCFTEWGHWRTEIIALVPADPSTSWSRLLLATAHAVAFWNRRIAFIKPDGTYDAGAKQPSAFYYFGERQGRFKRVFEPHATVLVLR
jgi:hypothetical protein